MKKSYRIICSVLVLTLLVCNFGILFSNAAGSDDYTTINIYGEYNQSYAQTMLALDDKEDTLEKGPINAFRKSPEAWWYTDDTKTGKEYADNLKILKYDYDLEKVAMQRAAEISLMFSHTRPNGQKYTTAYDELVGDIFQWKGENIAAGTHMTMEGAFNAWKEDGLPYSQQGHRRNMLNSNYTRIGIAYVRIDDMDYWVQEFGTLYDENSASSKYVPPADGKRKVRIQLLNSLVSGDPSNPVPPSAEPPKEKEAEVEYHATKDPPYALLTYTPKGTLDPSAIGDQPFLLTDSYATGDIDDEIKLPDGTKLYKGTKISNLDSDYESKDTSIVTVDSEGNLYGEALGETEVTISAPAYNISESFIVKVTPRDLKDAILQIDGSIFEFTGKGIEPDVTVYCDFVPLEKDKDYTVAYSDNRNVGKNATITVTGKGNYKGTASITFEITPLSIKDADITLEYTSTPYTGQERKPHLKSMKTAEYEFTPETASRGFGRRPILSAGTLPVIPVIEGEDYTIDYANNINTGTATAIVKGMGNLIDSSRAGEFEIVKTKLGDALITVEYDTVEYDGTEKKPKVTISVDGTELKEGTDFKVTYSDNVEIGKAGLKIEGLDAFDEIKSEREFTITPRSIKTATVTPEYTSTKYTGSELKPNVTVKLGDKTLTADDYTVAYSNNKDAGTATITVTGKGHYTDSAAGTFTITAPCQHDWGSGTITKAATCKEKGVKTFTCSKCNETKTEDIPRTDHVLGAEATCTTPQKCTVCGTVIAEATGKHKDLNSDGKCDVCGANVNYSPDTGSGNAPVLCMMIFLASALSAAALLIVNAVKRKKAE